MPRIKGSSSDWIFKLYNTHSTKISFPFLIFLLLWSLAMLFPLKSEKVNQYDKRMSFQKIVSIFFVNLKTVRSLNEDKPVVDYSCIKSNATRLQERLFENLESEIHDTPGGIKSGKRHILRVCF